jgi:hypothetical protein
MHFEQANDLERERVEATTAQPPRRSRRHRVGRAERNKNGQSSRADGGSMDPNALDRENWVT